MGDTALTLGLRIELFLAVTAVPYLAWLTNLEQGFRTTALNTTTLNTTAFYLPACAHLDSGEELCHALHIVRVVLLPTSRTR